MATNFDSTAFRASPFMRALTETDALTETEKKSAAREARQSIHHNNWLAHRRADVAFHRAKAAAGFHHLLRVTGAPDVEKYDAYLDELSQIGALIACIGKWSEIEKPNKGQRASFAKAIKEYRSAAHTAQTSPLWDLHEPKWMARLAQWGA